MRSPHFRANPAWTKSEHGVRLMKLNEHLLIDWFNYHNSPPSVLFHYTSVEGLLGVLETNRLWATHVGYSNDSSELLHSHELIQDVLKNQQSAATSPVLREFFDRAQSAISPFGGMSGYYISCFCEDGDLLSQWRGYANRVGGYAIGLKSREICLRLNPPPDIALRKIIYDVEIQRSLITRTVERTTKLLSELTLDQSVDEANRTIATFLSFLQDHLDEFEFSFKSPVFREENEWRIINRGSIIDRDGLLSQIKFRPALGIPTPYVELDLSPSAGANTGKLPIKTIICGPALNPEAVMQSLIILLQKYKYTFIEVRNSQVPLRY